MALHMTTLQAVFDDVAMKVTISGQGAAPEPPEGTNPFLWWPQSGPGFEFSVNVNSKNITAVPTAVYAVPDSTPVEKRLVEYRNGAWQMPGVPYTGT